MYAHPMLPGKTPVLSKSSVDEHNLYFARSATIRFSGRNYLGSAESPLCLLLSPAEDLSQKVLPLLHAFPKWNGICSQIRSAYMGGVSAVLARLVVPARPVKMSAPFKCPRPQIILTLFSKKNQKPNSAHKCPITSIQVCIESQKLSEFSCITFGSLNKGRPPF